MSPVHPAYLHHLSDAHRARLRVSAAAGSVTVALVGLLVGCAPDAPGPTVASDAADTPAVLGTAGELTATG